MTARAVRHPGLWLVAAALAGCATRPVPDLALPWSSGRLAALRTLAFERSTDRLLRRDDRQVVPFESKTLPHFDGLA